MKAGSLEEVYIYHMNDLYKYLVQLSGHPQTAEDLLHDTFLKAYENLESYGGEKVRPWLFRVAYNTYIDWYRKDKKSIKTDPQVLNNINPNLVASPEQDYLAKENLLLWSRVLHSLPDNSRQIIILRDYYDFTYQEIADILNISLAAVKVRLLRARQKLREVMTYEL